MGNPSSKLQTRSSSFLVFQGWAGQMLEFSRAVGVGRPTTHPPVLEFSRVTCHRGDQILEFSRAPGLGGPDSRVFSCSTAGQARSSSFLEPDQQVFLSPRARSRFVLVVQTSCFREQPARGPSVSDATISARCTIGPLGMVPLSPYSPFSRGRAEFLQAAPGKS